MAEPFGPRGANILVCQGKQECLPHGPAGADLSACQGKQECLPHGVEVVVKVGGSLFDLPDLGLKLRAWLEILQRKYVMIVPGGGAAANVIRTLDRTHNLGKEQAHWLALRALTLNGHWLRQLLPAGFAILDAFAFAEQDEGQPGALPHSWDATSDSIALRAALVAGARQLILLKSVDIPATMDWAEAARQGFVDPIFAGLAKEAINLQVRAINFRSWPSPRHELTGPNGEPVSR